MRSLVAILLVSLFAMPAQSVPIGLVLSGGGARGAYEVGVWKAMCELGCASDVVAISGSSVGGLNAAMFAAIADPKGCEDAWMKTIASAFSGNTNKVHDVLQKSLDDYASLLDERTDGGKRDAEASDFWVAAATLGLATLINAGEGVSKATEGSGSVVGFCDSARLRESLNELLPDTPFQIKPAVYVTAVDKANGGATAFSLAGLQKADVIDRLMASAALPVAFDSVEIDGVTYVDGGYEQRGGDNVPVTPILQNHPEAWTIIVVYLKRKDAVNRRIRMEDCKGADLIEIFPSRDIGSFLSVFDSSEKKSKALIRMGYDDAMKSLRSLKRLKGLTDK